MKALVGAFNQEKTLVGAFSVIVKTDCATDGSFYSTNTGTGQLLATDNFTLHLALSGFCAQLTSGPWQPREMVDMIVTDIPVICFIAETDATN